MGRSPGEFEQLLMFAVLDLEDRAYGVSIRRRIEERTGREISPGAVYTALERLESRGFVSSSLGEETPARGGRRKKFYRLEPEGAAVLQTTYRSVTRMAEGLLPRLAELAEGAGEGS
ncbi:MAG TPA: helix-turn-helix transcriptional regulator [Longimicrobiales bacterium]|nr:helix-turn-helix transcriptional regulator [Longimicrobiales bacterium]